MNFFKKIFLLLILGMLFLPMFQARFKRIHPGPNNRLYPFFVPLEGDFTPVPKPWFSIKTWFKGEYQANQRIHTEDSIGFKPAFTRIYNQLDYSLFSIAHAEYVVLGHHGNFFGEHYIRAYLGDYFIGKSWIDLKAWEFRRLQDILWNEKKIFLAVLFAPTKAAYFPEDWPNRFKERKRTGISNLDYWVQKCRDYGVNYIDYNNYFLKMRDTVRVPLYPPTGMHWSYYGAYLAADSMIGYLEKKMNVRLPRPILDSMTWSNKYKYHDDEVTRTMNLLWPPKDRMMPYPKYHFKRDSSDAKLKALVISDSYNWHWYEEGYNDNAFVKHEFWYYFKDCYPENFKKPTTTDKIDLKEEIEKYNVILVMQVNGGAGKMGYEFIDRAYDIYDTTSANPFRKIEKKIRGDAKWMETIRKNAKEKGITVEEEVRENAIFIVNKDLLRFYKNY
jgi:hypothetical protein